MFYKILIACVAVCLILASGGQGASAMPPQAKPVGDHPVTFQKVMDPVEEGLMPKTPENWAFGMTLKTFKNYLYAGVWDYWTGVEIVRSTDGNHWERVEVPQLKCTPQVDCYIFPWDMAVYKGQLYVALIDFDARGNPSLILRTSNGTDWEIAFKDDENHTLLGDNDIFKLSVIRDTISFTAQNGGGAVPGKGQVWRSHSGSPGTWELVIPEVGTDYLDSSSEMVLFKGKIYFSGHDATGLHVWRSSDGKTWEKLGQGTLDDPVNGYGEKLVAFKNALYVCTNNGRIYRSMNGVDWELLVPDGIGNPNSVFLSMIVYQGQLYAFLNTGSDNGPDVTSVWRTPSGNSGDWENITPGGLGPNTITVGPGQEVFKGRLYVATEWVLPTILYRMDEK